MDTSGSTSDEVPAKKALEAADELVSRGRLFEAIDVLTDANRSARSQTLERRLVRLRHEAFRQVEGSPCPSGWPLSPKDPFPGVRGLIEVEAKELSSGLASAAILHHGCLLVRGLIPEADVERLVADTDRAFEAYEDWLGRSDDPNASERPASPWFEPFAADPSYDMGYLDFARLNPKNDRVLLADSPPALFDTLEVFESVGVRNIVSDYFGGRPTFPLNKFLFRRIAPRAGALGWHQEAAVFRGRCRSLSCWTALSKCGVDAPGLGILPTRVAQALPTVPGTKRGFVISGEEIERFDVAPVVPAFEAGDALIFDVQLPHRTVVSPTMTEVRYCIEAWFIAPDGFPLKDGPMVY